MGSTKALACTYFPLAQIVSLIDKKPRRVARCWIVCPLSCDYILYVPGFTVHDPSPIWIDLYRRCPHTKQ